MPPAASPAPAPPAFPAPARGPDAFRRPAALRRALQQILLARAEVAESLDEVLLLVRDVEVGEARWRDHLAAHSAGQEPGRRRR